MRRPDHRNALQRNVNSIFCCTQTAVNTTDSQGRTALHVASARGHILAAKLLLNCGADVAIQDGSGATAVMAAVKCGQQDLVTALLRHKVGIHF